jgi:hypothetical protein
MKRPAHTVYRWLAAGLAGVAMAWGIAAPARAIAPMHPVIRGSLAAALPHPTSLGTRHPRLWFTRDQIPGLRQKIRSGTPQRMAALLLHDAARSLEQVAPSSDSGPAAGAALAPYVMETAMAYVLTGDRGDADRALAAIRRLAPLAAAGSLDWSVHGIALSFAYDACFDAWDGAARQEVAGRLVQIAHTLATFDEPAAVQLEPARNGFTVTSPAGATLVVRFAPGANLDFAVMHGPPTGRLFEPGRQTEYAGAAYVRATQVGIQAAFDAVLTLQQGTAPPVTFQNGQARVGVQTVRFEPELEIGR